MMIGGIIALLFSVGFAVAAVIHYLYYRRKLNILAPARAQPLKKQFIKSHSENGNIYSVWLKFKTLEGESICETMSPNCYEKEADNILAKDSILIYYEVNNPHTFHYKFTERMLTSVWTFILLAFIAGAIAIAIGVN